MELDSGPDGDGLMKRAGISEERKCPVSLLTGSVDVPWQEIADAIDGVVGDAFEDGSEIGFWIEAVELRGFDQGQGAGGTGPAFVGSAVTPAKSSR